MKLMNFFNERRSHGVGSSSDNGLDSAGAGDEGLISDVSDSRTLRQSEGSGRSRGGGEADERGDLSGGAKMAGKSGSSEVTRHMLWAYVAGVITGLALFGASSFYYERLFQ
jgi:hypothetical protein